MMSPKGGKLVPDKIIDEPAEQLFNEISNFDIRKGVCNDLMNPCPELNKIGSSSA